MYKLQVNPSKVSPFTIPALLGNTASGVIAIETGAKVCDFSSRGRCVPVVALHALPAALCAYSRPKCAIVQEHHMDLSACAVLSAAKSMHSYWAAGKQKATWYEIVSPRGSLKPSVIPCNVTRAADVFFNCRDCPYNSTVAAVSRPGLACYSTSSAIPRHALTSFAVQFRDFLVLLPLP